jgi:hypothetical protein
MVHVKNRGYWQLRETGCLCMSPDRLPHPMGGVSVKSQVMVGPGNARFKITAFGPCRTARPEPANPHLSTLTQGVARPL